MMLDRLTDGEEKVLRDTSRISTGSTPKSTGSTDEWYSRSQSIVIFDWDDTLCPSSWIMKNSPMLSFFRPPPRDPRFMKPLEELQDIIVNILESTLKLAKVVIVTNARKPWVTTSCRNFLPRVSKVLERIPVVYALTFWESWPTELRAGMYHIGGGAYHAAPRAMNRIPRTLMHGTTRSNSLSVAGHALAGNRLYSRPETVNAYSQSATQSGWAMRGTYATMGESPNSAYADTIPNRAKIAQLTAKLFSQPMQSKTSNGMIDLCLLSKELCFGIEISEFYSRYPDQCWENIISIGDAEYERKAVKHVVNRCAPPSPKKKKRTKSVKFVEEPTMEVLIKQLKNIAGLIPSIVNHDGDLDIEIDPDAFDSIYAAFSRAR